MSTESETYINNVPDGNQGRGKGRNNVYFIVLLLLLLLTSIGINVFQFNKEKAKEKDYTAEIFNSNELKAQLKTQLDTARRQLEEFKGRNANLDAAVAKDEKEMDAQAEQIRKMLVSNKINYNKYLDVKYKLDEMTYMKEKYLREVTELNEKNKQLTAENQDLKHEVNEGKHTINNLTDKVTSQKNKLDLAAMLKADNISVMGVYFKKNNKEVETSKSKNIQKLKFCFTLEENKFADAGKRDVYVQVVDPKGQTIAIESLGSGVTTVNASQSQYTVKQEIEYKNEPQNYCTYWGKDTPFDPGIYHIVLSTEGYKIGEKDLHIR
jgi:hypothetical protein